LLSSLDLARFWNVGLGSRDPCARCSFPFLVPALFVFRLVGVSSSSPPVRIASMPVSPPLHSRLWSLDMSTLRPPERGFRNLPVPAASAFSLAFPLSLCFNIACTVQFTIISALELRRLKSPCRYSVHLSTSNLSIDVAVGMRDHLLSTGLRIRILITPL